MEIARSEYYLKPGYVYVSQTPTIITTILGSCVSVCLFDSKHGFGGMNHFQLPEPLPGDANTTKFGTVSIKSLVQSMEEFGAARKNLQATLVGGASISENHQSQLVADLNIKVAFFQLEKYKIPVILSKTGGHRGRKVFYYTDRGKMTCHFVDDVSDEPELLKEFEA